MSGKPSKFEKLVVHTLTSNFRDAVSIQKVDMCQPKENEVCVRNKYVGVNATDVNITAGRYFVEGDPPFDVGLEGVGEVCCVGSKVQNLKVGQSVAYICAAKAYAEYVCMNAAEVFPVPDAKPEYIGLLIAGLTASIALDKAGRIAEGETVLITAAAGGTGHIAVQWAKAAGCRVIGTCSSKEKGEFLKSLGCDSVINYRTESISEALSKQTPDGVNVIWETIGGKVFEECLQHLATKGRLLIVGGISNYKSDSKNALQKVDISSLPELLLTRSASVQGFLLLAYRECFPTYFRYLVERVLKGEIKVSLDTGKESRGKEFVGMQGVIDGVEHLQSGKNIGKVIVRVH